MDSGFRVVTLKTARTQSFSRFGLVGFRVRVLGFGFGVWGLGFRVEGLGMFRV